jgi:hypothetical protein
LDITLIADPLIGKNVVCIVSFYFIHGQSVTNGIQEMKFEILHIYIKASVHMPVTSEEEKASNSAHRIVKTVPTRMKTQQARLRTPHPMLQG